MCDGVRMGLRGCGFMLGTVEMFAGRLMQPDRRKGGRVWSCRD